MREQIRGSRDRSDEYGKRLSLFMNAVQLNCVRYLPPASPSCEKPFNPHSAFTFSLDVRTQHERPNGILLGELLTGARISAATPHDCSVLFTTF